MELMITTCQFSDFVEHLVDYQNEENENRALWELWLHKVFNDTSYHEFRRSVLGAEGSDEQADAGTVDDAFAILSDFVPDVDE